VVCSKFKRKEKGVGFEMIDGEVGFEGEREKLLVGHSFSLNDGRKRR
jgi:hypothetical protein